MECLGQPNRNGPDLRPAWNHVGTKPLKITEEDARSRDWLMSSRFNRHYFELRSLDNEKLQRQAEHARVQSRKKVEPKTAECKDHLPVLGVLKPRVDVAHGGQGDAWRDERAKGCDDGRREVLIEGDAEVRELRLLSQVPLSRPRGLGRLGLPPE